MANRLKYGLHFVKTIDGSNKPQLERHPVASAYANRIDIGDPIKLLASGYVDLSAAGEVIYGVVAGIEQYYDGAKIRSNTFLPAASTWGTVWERRSILQVIPIVGNVFRGLTDATSGTYNSLLEFLAMRGENIDLVATGTPPASSDYLLDISTHAETTAQLRIKEAPHPDVDTEIDSAYVPLLVTGNEATTQHPGYVGTEAGV